MVAAGDLFGRYGVDQVSLDDIATAAGVHRATLHRHFAGGRDELVPAVVDHEAALFLERLLDVVAGSKDARSAIVDVVTDAVMALRSNQVLLSLLHDPTSRASSMKAGTAQIQAGGIEVWNRIITLHGTPETERGGPSTKRVVDLIFRVMVSLAEYPGDLPRKAHVRRFVADFIVPATLGR